MTSRKERHKPSQPSEPAKTNEAHVLLAAMSLLGMSLGAGFDAPLYAASPDQTIPPAKGHFRDPIPVSMRQPSLAPSQDSVKEPSLAPSRDSMKEPSLAPTRNSVKERSPAAATQESIKKPSAQFQESVKQRSPENR
jgi:hypothetical protein